ncbi:MAG: hypothetical protein K1X53_06075 [Candidatus Sumerlaeaceae bacterium]|nr:hypothetical protein [Candidatus Sumerlaeaceae bacterium]
MSFRSFLIAFFLVAIVGSGCAQPARFNYQAKLTDSGGAPLTGAHTLYFSLFQGGSLGVADSGTLVFKESAAISIVNGVASHSVGTGSNITGGALSKSMLDTSSDVYLQVAVDSQMNVVLPRTRIDSVPYALLSADGERRIALSGPAPITISSPGSYFLTGNLSVTSGNAINITTRGVTLDLNGYNLSSSEAVPTGMGISIANVPDVWIRNGSITGGVSYNGMAYVGPGFLDGIGLSSSTPTNLRASNLSVSKCKRYGINFGGGGGGNLVESCVVDTVGYIGAHCNNAVDSTSRNCGDKGFYCITADNCSGQSNFKEGVDAYVADNCYGYSHDSYGLSVYTCTNCLGDSQKLDGIIANTVMNSNGFAREGGNGIYVYTVTNSNGFSTSGTGVLADSAISDCYGFSSTGDGLASQGTVSNSSGASESGRGIYAKLTANNCSGTSKSGVGIVAGIATTCHGISDTTAGLTILNIGAMSWGERKMPPATGYVLGGGQAGPLSLP